MPRGYPDFFGFSIFPWHGSTYGISDTIIVAANAETVILTITGKGILLAGFMRSLGVNVQMNDQPRLYVDGQIVLNPTWLAMLQVGESLPKSNDFVLTTYNIETFTYCASLYGAFPFGSSISLRYLETHGRTPSIAADLEYNIVL